MKRFFKSFKSDRGDSLVSFIIVVPVLLMILITSVDYGIFMLNRGQIQAVARDAARTVAIYGGNGDASKATPIENAYGVPRGLVCSSVGGWGVDASTSSAVECNTAKALQQQRGLVNVKVKKIECTPRVATSIGERVSCDISWEYGGVAGSFLSFIDYGGVKHAVGTSESEVRYNGAVDLVNRQEVGH